jgi:hypothetical protein
MKEEALKLADELDALHQYVPSEAPAMIRRLVEELDKQEYQNELLENSIKFAMLANNLQDKQCEPVAWYYTSWVKTNGKPIHDVTLNEQLAKHNWSGFGDIQPLYTTPQTKTSKCIVKDCENHKHQGGFTGDLCNPCYEFIATGKGVYSQAYRNTQTKPLSDEEIGDCVDDCFGLMALQHKYTYSIDQVQEYGLKLCKAIEERHGIK